MTKVSEKTLIIIAIAVASAIVVGVVAISHDKTPSNSSNSVQKYTHIDIVLKDGKLVDPISTYEVKQGAGLEFSITSDKLGKIGAPTDPAQTITFTESPLVFHFTTSKAGTLPITYQANGSSKVIEIGIVTVRSTK